MVRGGGGAMGPVLVPQSTRMACAWRLKLATVATSSRQGVSWKTSFNTDECGNPRQKVLCIVVFGKLLHDSVPDIS